MTHITYPVQAMATKLDQNMANQVTLNVTDMKPYKNVTSKVMIKLKS